MGLFNENGKTPAKDFVTRLSAKGGAGEAAGRELITMATQLGTDIQGVILSMVSSDIKDLDAVEAVFAHTDMPLQLSDSRAKA